MNPSAKGWTLKLSHELNKAQSTWADAMHLKQFHAQTGFLFGAHLRSWDQLKLPAVIATDEIAKINLFISFYSLSVQHAISSFEPAILQFYSDLGLVSSKSKLERLIDSRVHPVEKRFNTALGTSMTNVLLYFDVLLYENYLKDQKVVQHAIYFEQLIFETIQEAASLSKSIDQKHLKIVKLIEDSRPFRTPKSRNTLKLSVSDLPENLSHYALSMACTTLWTTHGFSKQAMDFIYTKGLSLGLSEAHIHNLSHEVDLFYTHHYSAIPHLKDHNLVYHYYEGITQLTTRLIYRNRDRIKRELEKNKALLRLLKKSTQTELSDQEKKQLRIYMTDSFKSIPSIALFLLPGGSVILPVIASLLPKLLPASFDDNRIE